MRGSRMIVLVLAGAAVCCAPQAETEAARGERARGLSREIVKMAPAVPADEAGDFARRAVDVSARKRDEWGVRLSPWLHNGMVNMGLKPAGRCYEWAAALYRELDDEVPSGLEMSLVRSGYRTMREHHAISLHKRSKPWSGGILLDGWQEAGRLVYMPIGESERTWEFEAEEPRRPRPSPFNGIPKATGG